MVSRSWFGLIAVLAVVLLLGCSSDDTDDANSSGGGSESAICDELDAVREDFGNLQQAVSSVDVSGAQSAIDQMRSDMAQLRDEVSNSSPSDAAKQSAGDLAGAVQGLETTMRQVGQGGTTPQGVLQQLAIQLPVIASSLDSLRSELSCP